MTEFTDILTNFGFPIFAYVAMFWYMKTRETENDKRFDALSEKQNEQLEKMTDAITNNTVALTALTEIVRNGK